MKRALIISLLLISLGSAWAQDFIGMNERGVRKIMSEEHPGLAPDEKVRNDTFRYLKYSSGNENETWVIFFDEKGKCSGVRITCDNSFLDGKRKELDTLYKPAEKDSWTHRSGGDEISIRLKDETWFFTITYQRTQKQGKSGNDRTA
jgi:hypothetical protein